MGEESQIFFTFLTCVRTVQTIFEKILFDPQFLKKCTRECNLFNVGHNNFFYIF